MLHIVQQSAEVIPIGSYNPHLPQILGQEWVPIRDVGLVYSPGVNAVEQGVAYTQTTTERIRDARFYVNEMPQNINGALYQVGLVNIYPNGNEALIGPIREVIIPCNSGSVTGTTVSINGLGTVADAVGQPGDGKRILIRGPAAGEKSIDFYFATSQYAQLLQGKRILNVSLLYGGVIQDVLDCSTCFTEFVNPLLGQFPSVTSISQYNDAGQGVTFSPEVVLNNTGTLNLAASVDNPAHDSSSSQTINALDLGDVNNFWDPASPPFLTNIGERIMPWTYAALARLEASATNRQRILLRINLPTTAGTALDSGIPQIRLDYIALRVIFCEETRVAYGGQAFRYRLGGNTVRLRDAASTTDDPVIVPGPYLPTLSFVSPGKLDFGRSISGSFPTLNAVRQLYEIPSHPAVQLNIPFPLEDRIGETFTEQSTAILPQLSLHASGGTLLNPHVYGRQDVAQVFGSVTATQDILDGPVGGATTFPWVRFYCRRWGSTTIPLMLDSPTIAGSSVSITPSEFDALDEVLDGWKAVSLRFTTPPTMGAGTNPIWRWSATGELAGNRWEILGCQAFAISGDIPGSYTTPIPSPNKLTVATYGQPVSGAGINLAWVSWNGPYVSGSTDDETSDATLIFAQDMPAVTGFSVSIQSQALTGIGQECGIDPCGIPTRILYPLPTWGAYANSAVVSDSFSRAATGWASADSGQVYTDSGGTVEGDYITTGTRGTHTLTTVNVVRHSTLDSTFATNSHHRVKISTNGISTGASVRGAVQFNTADTSNYDFVDLQFATSQTAEIVIARMVAGVSTDITSVSAGFYGADQEWWLDVDVAVDGTIRAKAWPVGNQEPSSYQATTTATFTSGAVGLRSIRSTGNTNPTTPVISFGDYSVSASTWNFGYLELQRSDELTDWATIMKATSPAITSFRDYEARVGMSSSYRIRGVDVYDFAGPWSSTVSISTMAPGVSGSCLDQAHVMIFTTNEHQSGYSNLAYSNAWEDTVSEDFGFAEAGFTQLQPMYNRDFFTAFRPTERGGEQFTRSLLVQAAAIAPETLGDFQSLRDMAWTQVPYICVRDEDGNRWLANVTVPNGVVQNRRRLYLASVGIVEVTDTPSPVDPSWP
jgi:hypothetical protein